MTTRREYQAPTVTRLGRINSRPPAPGVDGRTVLADVETEGGWSLRVTKRGKTFAATLDHRDGGYTASFMFWPSVDRIWESLSTHLTLLRQGHVATVLRTLAETEMRR